MFKLRAAICLALFASTLTLLAGLWYEARLTTIIYRTMISLMAFGMIGLIVGGLAESFFHEFLQKLKIKGQKVEIISEKEPTQKQEEQSAAFSPFNPDNFEHIAQNKE
jgi:hypothetical protein